MAEGTVGEELDALIELKYSSQVIKDQHERIASARAERRRAVGSRLCGRRLIYV